MNRRGPFSEQAAQQCPVEQDMAEMLQGRVTILEAAVRNLLDLNFRVLCRLDRLESALKAQQQGLEALVAVIDAVVSKEES